MNYIKSKNINITDIFYNYNEIGNYILKLLKSNKGNGYKLKSRGGKPSIMRKMQQQI